MNPYVLPTVFWSVLVTSLWLSWQSVMVAYKINILTCLSNWFKNRPIILPTIFFIVSPFLTTKIFQDFSLVISTPLTIITTAASIFIGNRYLEEFKQNQEQKKIAKLLIISIQEHLKYLKPIPNALTKDVSKEHIESIKRKINRINSDNLYQESLAKSGLFTTEVLAYIINYNQILKTITDDMLTNNNVFKGANYTQSITRARIASIQLEGNLCIIVLNQKIMKDQKALLDIIERTEEVYCKVKSNFDDKIIQDRENIIQKSLTKTDKFFEDLGRIHELNNRYNQSKLNPFRYSLY